MKNKNGYFKLTIILIGTIILTIITCNLYRNYDGNKANISYISKYVTSIQYKELSNAITELNSNSFIYLTYIGNKNIYESERKIRKVLKKYDLEDNFIYVDCTNDIDDNNHVSSLKNIFTVGKREIKLPAIIYFKDNNPVDYIDSTEGLIDGTRFTQLLDEYEIESIK